MALKIQYFTIDNEFFGYWQLRGINVFLIKPYCYLCTLKI